jgi:hypothetical protein
MIFYLSFLALVGLCLRQIFVIQQLKNTIRQYQIDAAYWAERQRQNNRQRL